MDQKGSTSNEPVEFRGPWRWLAGVIAGLLALAVVGGLVYSRVGANKSHSESRGLVAVSGVDFTCRLPVLAGATGAFISFPNGAITIDSSVNSNNMYKSGYGNTYDAKVGKWVPVPRSALSPDGRSYAYMAQTTGVPGEMNKVSLHTHEIVSGKDRLLWEGSGSSMGPNAVTWLPSGIYFWGTLNAADPSQRLSYPAVYMADPNQSGTPRRVGPNPPPQPPTPGHSNYSGPDMFTLFGGGAAWGTGNRVPKEAPSPNQPPAPGTYGPDRVQRMDLRDGSVSTWYSVSGTDLVSLMGMDEQGRPILSLYPAQMKTAAPPVGGPPQPRLLLLTGAGQTAEITASNPDFHLAGQLWADSHGIWFGSWNSLWLYSPRGGLRQVATFPAGVFPSPTPPPGYPQKPIASGARSGMPPYMQGTVVMPAGSCT